MKGSSPSTSEEEIESSPLELGEPPEKDHRHHHRHSDKKLKKKKSKKSKGNKSSKDVTSPDDEEAPTVTKEETDSKATDESSSENAKKPDDPLASISDVFSFATTCKTKFTISIGIFCAAISGCVFPGLAFIFANSFTDLAGSVEGDDYLANIRNLAWQLMGLGAVAFVFMTLQAGFLETAAGEMAENLKIQWFEALLRQDMAYYDITDVSGAATIIGINGKKFRNGLGRKLGDGIQFSLTIIGGLAYGFYSSWRVSLTVLAVVPFMALSFSYMFKMLSTKTARANSAYAKAGGIVYTAISSIRTIISLNAVQEVIDSYEVATQEAYDGAASQALQVGLASGVSMGCMLLCYIPLTLYGAYLLANQVSEDGCDPSGAVPDNFACDPAAFDVFGALMGVTFAGSVFPQVSSTLEAFTGARSACFPALVAMRRKVGTEDGQIMAPVISVEKDSEAPLSKSQAVRRGSLAPLPKYEIDSSADTGIKPEDIEGNISFQNVFFSYPTRQEVNVFSGFSLDVQKGQTVALCGPSGGGKSTVVQLMERFYDPSDGKILLDGRDLKTLNVKWLRSHIGLVSQEPKLFAMSIKENIKIGCPDATDEEIEEAAKKANAHDFITSFSDGYNTEVGDEGAQLSGGQKQRIAIARVLVKKPKIILLDEATSALDSESEIVVQEALDKLMEEGNQTVIVIAHRLSTIRNADMIAVVQDGKIAETGTHSELLDRQGAYFRLIEAQKGNKVQQPSSDESSGAPSRRSSISSDNGDSDEKNEPGEDNDETVEFGEAGNILQFKNVSFHYPSRPEQTILHRFNLDIKEGETLALVGPSGQGKSTVIQLIENFYRPTHGRVKYKGVDMKDLNPKWLHNEIGLVSQEPVLFDNSIKENIRYGMPNATQEEIEEAAKEANAHDFIMGFPDGYDTSVGSSGSAQVSGGQKQRIAIARALLRKPKVLLLDEATSALDSESEQVVQAALDKITADKAKTVVVIAHRLSTIKNADRIAVINHGKVRELGSHDELMALDGHYKRLQDLQDLGGGRVDRKSILMESKKDKDADPRNKKNAVKSKEPKEEEKEIDKELALANAKKARELSRGDEGYFVVGAIGAVFAGLMFPGWGFVFAYMIELLYKPVFPCDLDHLDCQAYLDQTADDMRELSWLVFYGLLGIMVSSIIGHTLVHWAFDTASERMNKRVRDAAFQSLIRQEVGYFDLHPIGFITSQLSDDAALIHSFSGEPIRTLVMNLASVFVGLVVSFVFMWPFALLVLAALPFMGIGSMLEMKAFMSDEGADMKKEAEKSSGGIVVESLLNIRTVASLTLEDRRKQEFVDALNNEDPTPMRTNVVKGSTAGLSQILQMWCFALMFWWGGWLLYKYPGKYTFRDQLISMFSLLFSLSGMGIAMQHVTDRDKAKAAADRIFKLVERQSEIDPLSEEGQKDLTLIRVASKRKSKMKEESKKLKKEDSKKLKKEDSKKLKKEESKKLKKEESKRKKKGHKEDKDEDKEHNIEEELNGEEEGTDTKETKKKKKHQDNEKDDNEAKEKKKHHHHHKHHHKHKHKNHDDEEV